MTEKKQKIGVHIGRNFLEAASFRGNKLLCKRYFLGEHNEIEAIDAFLSELQAGEAVQVQISCQWAEEIVRKRVGANMALFVTEGFQHWPYLRQPAFDKRYRRLPMRNEPVLPNDAIFGISERTNAKAEIEKAVDPQELDFLHTKLQLMQVDCIGIGFLHSAINPRNEQQVADYFRERGYHVLCSHSYPQANEVARWWRTAMDVYVSEFFRNQQQQLQNLANKHNLQIDLIDSEASAIAKESSAFFSSKFGRNAALAALFPRENHLLYLGLEEFLYIKPQQQHQYYESEFGPICLQHHPQSRMGIQPTQVIEPNAWNVFRLGRQELGYEPGPMLLGRSVTPCLVDLLFVSSSLQEIEGLQTRIRPNSKSRILESLYTLGKASEFEGQLDRLVEQILDTALKRLAIQIGKQLTENESILLTGPLAASLFPLLTQRLPHLQLRLDSSSSYCNAIAALQLEVNS